MKPVNSTQFKINVYPAFISLMRIYAIIGNWDRRIPNSRPSDYYLSTKFSIKKHLENEITKK